MGDWKDTILMTGVDKLLDIIVSTKEITVGEVSRQLGVKPSIIESWATALANDNIITTSYNSQGELVFKSTKQNQKIKEGKIETLKKDVKSTLKSVELDFEDEENILNTSKNHIRSFEQILKSDINHIESFNKDLKIYDNKKSELIRLVKKLKSEESILEKEIVQIEGREKKIQAETGKIKKVIDTKVAEVAKSKKNIIEIENSKNELKKDFKVLKRISNAIKHADSDKIGTKIDEIDKKAKNLKTHNSLTKQKFEKLSEILTHIFK